MKRKLEHKMSLRGLPCELMVDDMCFVLCTCVNIAYHMERLSHLSLVHVTYCTPETTAMTSLSILQEL